MGATVDELERLAALHRSGVLTDDEFTAQKARMLGSSNETVTPLQSAASILDQNRTWQRRFAFFRANGSPFSSAGTAALAQMPFWTATAIRMNVWAFLLGPFYFFFLGLWRRGVALSIISIVTSYVIEFLLGDAAMRGVSIGLAVIFSMTANYYHFIKVTQGRDEWNPLADLFPAQRHQAPGEIG